MKKSFIIGLLTCFIFISSAYSWLELQIKPGLSFYNDANALAGTIGLETDSASLLGMSNLPGGLVLGAGVEGVMISNMAGILWNVGAYGSVGWQFAFMSNNMAVTPFISLGGGYMSVSDVLGSLGGPLTMTLYPALLISFRLDKDIALGLETGYRIWFHDTVIRNMTLMAVLRFSMY